MNSYFWFIDGTPTSTTTLTQSGSECNGNKEALHVPATPRPEPHPLMQSDVIPRKLNGFKYCYLTLIIQLLKFLRRSFIIFIIKGFRTIVFIFIVISTTFWPICPLAFFRCLSNSATFTELQTTSFIESRWGRLFWFH